MTVTIATTRVPLKFLVYEPAASEFDNVSIILSGLIKAGLGPNNT